MRNVSGFTLIEVMITVAIIAILSAIAIPSYNDYVVKGKIPEATTGLASKRVQAEQFYQDNLTYDQAPSLADDPNSSKYFTFTGVGTANTFTLTATGTGTMAGFVYTIDQAGAKATTGVPTGWTAASACWVTSKGGSC